ncbi:MAG: pyridoxal phosphate-dependent aminotransferase [Candidatus Puniceispirillaceae bacterium]
MPQAQIAANAAAMRLGTESAFKVLARAGALAAAGRDIINLGIGQPDFRTPDHIVEAGINALRDGAHGYTPSLGLPALCEAVSADAKMRYGADINPGLIQIVPGAKPIMFAACQLLGGVDTEILLPDPGFPIYASAAAFSGARAVSYGLVEDKGFAFEAADLLSKITEKTRLIIINSPANPTGGVTPKSEIDKLVAGLGDFPHVTLLSDEIYDRLSFGDKPVSLLQYPEIRDRLIVLNGWSKTYAMTGWRIGYGIWPEALIDYADRLAVNYHSCVNAPTQHAALAALTGDQTCVEEMRTAFMRRADLMTRLLNDIGGISAQQPGGAFYVFANISKTGLSADDFQHRLLEEYGVAGIAGTSFGALGEGFIRLSCANSDEAITEACARIQRFVATLG